MPSKATQPIPDNVVNRPITALSGVGTKIAEQLAQLGIERIFDLLLHLPRDYEDRSRLVNIAEVANGQSVLIQGKIVKSDNKRTGMSVVLQDATGQLMLRFFHVYRGLADAMRVGNVLRVFGEVIINQYGTQISHPEFELITEQKPLANTGLVPIYPTVKGLHQNKLRSLIKLALQTVKQNQPNSLIQLNDNEWQSIEHQLTVQFPLLARLKNPFAEFSWMDALSFIHQPPIYTDLAKQYQVLEQLKNRSHPTCQRLIIEEMLANQLGLLYRKQHLYQHKAPRCDDTSALAKNLLANLPFSPTNAQARVVGEIVQDLATSKPMLRLVQGDVGAGKTLVAGLSACYALDSGWQVAIMAPTEILAEQHFINFKNWFEPLGIGVGWLAGKQTAKERTLALQQIADNDVQIVVGTHALFQDSVQFAKLGLVIIDEQHRFGVEQRMALLGKGLAHTTPHQLIMTATPIPRTLAMSAFGDMDTSIIDELPPNRTPITTVTISRDRRDEVIERIAVNCEQGKQAYWVCPLVEESSVLDAQSAELTYADLDNRLNLNIGLVHGKMKPTQKQQVMQDFKDGKTSLLVATTVIEVGVDVPNASLMVIENAERLGLSQLHQLRGRVGRGSQKSFCVLLYQTPLSESGIERLNVLRDSTDGFVIAQKDLELRGAGELLGKRQTGFDSYYISDLVRDEFLLIIAQSLAKYLLNQPDKKTILHQLIEQWTPNAIKFINA
ncbi:ATP-dependent DNA helicase RecG [Faucicola boevrei]|uniref:ATP-dependent DNA helicase RecG n=1 Tax=Faucicola boevrei TaxID=346665 RepID=UPI00037C497A|nr:ATP-dependent DNA helicase RecG [Moraxella boevrei]